MTQLQNQFVQSAQKGMTDLRFNANTMSCRVYTSEAVALVPGQAVKLVDAAGGTPIVTAITADTDKVFGFVNYNIKDVSFAADASVEISAFGNVLYLEASAAIARGADVMAVVTGSKVATATEGKTVVGMALDKATADTNLIRVLLMPPVSAVSDGYTPQTVIAALDQDISAGYVEAEVQAISDKVDEILAALKAFGAIASA